MDHILTKIGLEAYHSEIIKYIQNQGATKVTVDSSLSSTSTNPVQNKVINSALSGKVPNSRTVNGKALSANITLSASDVGADASGSATSALNSAKSYSDTNLATAKSYTDQKVAALVGTAPETMDTLEEVAAAIEAHKDVTDALNYAIGNKVDKVSGKGLSTNDLTNTLKSNYDTAYIHSQAAHAPSNAERNTVVGIQKNGTDLTPDSSTRKVNITVPTKTSEITNDSGFLTSSGTISKANQLTNTRTIDGMNFNGTASIHHFAECSTAAGTAAKTVTLSGFVLATGARITVKFTVTNTAASPTLNVNSTGAKSIMYRGSAISAGYLAANRVYEFIYDGSDWELIGDLDTNSTYGAAGSSLGLVKTGGDVTISNGVVTVNDDSHNHVISNIDGLQSALDGKAKVYELAKSANLNDIITPGFYNVGGSNTITNKPSGVYSFGLIVIHRASGSYYTQILYYSQNSYRRHCENGTWSSWTQDKLTDTDTWRGIQNNLTSDSTSDSLSAAQGKALKTLIDGSTISQSDIDAIFV